VYKVRTKLVNHFYKILSTDLNAALADKIFISPQEDTMAYKGATLVVAAVADVVGRAARHAVADVLYEIEAVDDGVCDLVEVIISEVCQV